MWELGEESIGGLESEILRVGSRAVGSRRILWILMNRLQALYGRLHAAGG